MGKFKPGQIWVSGKYIVEIVSIEAHGNYPLIAKYIFGDSGEGAWNIDGKSYNDGRQWPDDLNIQITKENNPEYWL